MRWTPRRGAVMAASIAAARVAFGYLFGHLVVAQMGYTPFYAPYKTASRSIWALLFDRWDSAYYLAISTTSYPANRPYWAPFFPGYPLLVRLFNLLTGHIFQLAAAAEIVSGATFIASSAVMYLAVRRFKDHRFATYTILFYVLYPTSLFFFSPYPESLVVLEISLVLLLLDGKHFVWASLVAGYASATSLLALAATTAVVVVMLINRRPLWRVLVASVTATSGLLGYMYFLYQRFGNPIMFVYAQKHWSRSANFPWWGVFENFFAFSQLGVNSPGNPTRTNIDVVWMLDDAAALVALILFVFVAYKLYLLAKRRAFVTPETLRLIPWGIVFVIAVLIPVSSSIYPYGRAMYSTEAEARLLSVCVPLYPVAIAFFKRLRIPVPLILFASSVGMVGAQIMFNRGFWLT